jgi:SAM-dependent methyltransferase
MNKSMGDLNKLADCYDYYHSAHNNFIELLKKEYKENKDTKIVDVGCGTGNETLNIYNKLKCTVYGIDPAENMLKKAMGKSDKIEWVKGLAEKIPVGNNSIDIITLFFSIHHFLDIYQAIKEFHRILKSAGKVFIFTISHNQMKNSLEYHFFPELLKYDISRVPSIEFIEDIFVKNGFKVKIKEVAYETRKIDTNYIEMVKRRYRSGFQKLTENETLMGINRIEEAISNNKNIIDDIKCSVLICEK